MRIRLHAKTARREINGQSILYVSSGAYLLDLVLGGGWAAGRVANIVGDRSSGKTGLAIEACVNYAMVSGPRYVCYAEAEHAMDHLYAENLGMPQDIVRTQPGELETVEHMEKHFLKFVRDLPGDNPAIYVLDSLDALTDTTELKRDIGDASYGTARAKMLSEFFRKHTGLLEQRQCTMMIVSQVRDAIGVRFGERNKRAGGRALGFYASQELWLSELGKIQRTVLGEKRAIGIDIRARTKKLKVGMPFREANLALYFNYGLDDEASMYDWLDAHKATKLIQWHGDPIKDLWKLRRAQDRDGLYELNSALRAAVSQHWQRIEHDLAPPMRKYRLHEA